MKTKKYLSVIVIIFLVMNLVIANENISTSQEQTTETDNSIVTPVSEDTNQVEQSTNKTQDNAKTIDENAKVIEKEIIDDSNITFSVQNSTLEVNPQQGACNNSASCTNTDNSKGETSLSTFNVNVSSLAVSDLDEDSINSTNKSFLPGSEIINQSNETSKETNKDYSYININNINSGASSQDELNISETPNNKTAETEGNESLENAEDKSRTIKIMLFRNGKKEIEGEIPENFADEINKEERILDTENFSKEIIIKSDEHLDSPLVVYSDIPENIKKDDINLYWKNQDREIEIKEYIDENSDGFIERISWVVPHLSEQIFEIRIGVSESGTSSEEIILTATNPLNGETITSNPVNFDFNINYTNISNLDCILTIDNNDIPFSVLNETLELNLQNGTHNWKASCADQTNNSKKGETSLSTFTVNVGPFLITGLDEIYMNGTTITFSVPPGYNINKITLEKPSGNETITPSGSSITIPSTSTTQTGTYSLEINSARTSDGLIQITTKQFSVENPTAQITRNKNNVDIGENVVITIDIDSPIENILMYTLKFGDGNSISSDNYYPYVSQITNQQFSHSYSDEKTYTLELIIYFENGQPLKVTKNGITVTNSGDDDTSDPSITLIEPSNNLLSEDRLITFRYKASDNVKLDECTYELYLYSDSSDYASLEYEETKKNPSNNQEIKIQLRDFEVGNYTWYVTCYDNSSNYDEESRKFRITSSDSVVGNSNYAEKDDISKARSNLDSFLADLDSESPDEKAALEDMNTYSDLVTYQKRLLQIQKYFETDYRNIPDDKRNEVSQDYLDELNEIIDNTPVRIDIIKTDEYIKNSISESLKETLSKIITARTPSISKKTLNKLVESNFAIQDRLTTSVNSKQIEIEYDDRTDEITLVTKTVKATETGDALFEILPESFEDPVFVINANKLEGNIFEIDQDDLDNGKIVYYTENIIDLENVKGSETILFEDSPSESLSRITGYTIVGYSFNHPINYIIIAIFLIMLIYSGFRYWKKREWKNAKEDMTISDIISNIEKSKHALMQNNLESAKISYHKIEETYPFIEKKHQKKLQKEVKKIKVGIAKRDIINLMREYETARKEKRISDSKILYKKIQQVYKELPKKHKEKVYKKIFANPLDNFF